MIFGAALLAMVFLTACRGGGVTINLPDPGGIEVDVDEDGNGGTAQQNGTGQSQNGGSGQSGGTQNATFEGVWDSTFGELRLHRVGDYVIGDYKKVGIFLGRRKGDCLAGIFTNKDQSGIFRFELTDPDEFEGRWAWHGDSLHGSWGGTRKGQPSNTLHNFARNGTTQTLENSRDVYDGVYDSTYEDEVKLYSRDLFLIGDYGDVGIFAGMWDGDSFVGTFTNGADVGWFDFEFLSRQGNFQSGEWGWYGKSRAGNWSLSRTKKTTPKLDNMVDDVSCP
jgi:hypothetical protein